MEQRGVNWFQSRGSGIPSATQKGDPSEVVSKLDTALTAIFSEDGKRTVIYYLTNRYGLTLEQASADPSKLEKALTGMLGEVGWMVVKRAILEEFWERKIELSDTHLVERASLREVFGLVHGLGFMLYPGPR